MVEAQTARRRIAAVAGIVALGICLSATVVVVARTAGSDEAAAKPVASASNLAAEDSDVLSEEQARARDRAKLAAERARILGLQPPAPADEVAPAPAIPVTGDVDCSVLKCVALTFDDGPGAQTSQVLAALAEYNAVATWFPLGEMIADNPDALRAIAAAGHEIGNHSWSHPQLTALRERDVNRQITRTADLIAEVTGVRPTLVRPPYGSVSRRVNGELARLQAPIILWDVDPLDWRYQNTDRVHRSVVRQTKPGSIVLMHDIHRTTVAAVPRILRSLAHRGYTFVTVSQLYGNSLQPGRAYTDRRADLGR
ncbi:hypothetical protein GCM10009547_30240 [Sporichthya brevicatena]|uniref:NodB homology domain-containing protein n=1 Tax=Sporichthya brevicatena TaxID=171442 RepID=A0ABP3S3G2_9ACTN